MRQCLAPDTKRIRAFPRPCDATCDATALTAFLCVTYLEYCPRRKYRAVSCRAFTAFFFFFSCRTLVRPSVGLAGRLFCFCFPLWGKRYLVFALSPARDKEKPRFAQYVNDSSFPTIFCVSSQTSEQINSNNIERTVVVLTAPSNLFWRLCTLRDS